MKTYQNIINQERPVPARPRMPRQNRAKIFAPYQALKGFNKTLHSKDTVYEHYRELAEYGQECLDQKLRRLQKSDKVTVTWFCPKPGKDDHGQYMTVTDTVKRIDPVFHVLHLSGESITFKNIIDLRGEHFEGITDWEPAGEVQTPEETVR